MDTIISKVDFAEPLKDIDVIEKAAEILQSGGLVAFPTETVYGLGANGLDAEAVKKIVLQYIRQHGFITRST